MYLNYFRFSPFVKLSKIVQIVQFCPYCPILSILFNFVHYVQSCPNCSIFSKLSNFVQIVQFCPYCSILSIMSNFIQIVQLCPYCPILYILSNFAHIFQLCPTLQHRAEVLKLSILFTLQIQDFLTENWVTFYCELSVKLKCIACLIALILTKNSLHRIQPRNSSDSKRKNDTCPEGLDLIRISSFSNLKCQETSLAERNFWPNALHTIRKVKFLSKNSILTKHQDFHEFFTQIFFENFSREIKVVNS